LSTWPLINNKKEEEALLGRMAPSQAPQECHQQVSCQVSAAAIIK
jgi:hypothetical protein